jgi:preprotein translocase subunit SecE
MNNMLNSRMKFNELVSWLAIASLTIAAFFGTYYFHFSAPIKALIWIGWLVLTLFFGFFTTKGKQVVSFGNESKIELQKVVWPSRQETIQTTSIVMIMVTITGFVLWGIDSGMLWAIGKITHLG